jgi:hypothetical protein
MINTALLCGWGYAEGLGCALLLSMTGLEGSIFSDNYDKLIFRVSPGWKLPS